MIQKILYQVCYMYSKEAMEAFFKDTRLFELFKMYAEQIKQEGYITCEKRRDNRTDCQNKSDSSHMSSVGFANVSGHSVVSFNVVTRIIDETQTETMFDQSEESESGSIYSDGDVFEEEKSQKEKKRRQGPIDIKTLSDDQIQEYFRKEIDILL